MGKELIVVEPAIEPELFTPPVHLGAGAANDQDDRNALEGLSELEKLEAGIASVFGSLRADLETGANDDDAPNPIEPLELEPADLLLAELNRLWAQPRAA